MSNQFAVGWGNAASRTDRRHGRAWVAHSLLRIVDSGLLAIICIAPFFFGGRHDLGRLVFVTLVAVSAAAWFARQALFPRSSWHRTVMHAIIACAAAWLLLQILPMPSQWIAFLSPRTAELLPMWNSAAGSNDQGTGTLGEWRTLSLAPHETAKCLAMIAAYGLLFVVVTQRISDSADVRRLLGWIGLASVLMAGFGLLQYFTSDGPFFWFYEHPFRSANQYVTGSFINRNHFASFLVLGTGPLAVLLIEIVRLNGHSPLRKNATMTSRQRFSAILLTAALALVVFATLSSLSRGGAIVLLVAAIVFSGICLYRRLLDVRMISGLLFFGIIVVGLLSSYGYDEVAQRLDDFAAGSIESIDQDEGRRKIWSANVAAFRAGWLTGAGAGTHLAIYPIYLPETHAHEYTHAENGYLQIATETGFVGLMLLAGAIGVCGCWCIICLRNSSEPNEIVSSSACVAGLAASAAHSAFDFVWYIPACMATTTVLAACTLRLAQMTRSSSAGSAEILTRPVRSLPRARWLEMAMAVVLIGSGTVLCYFGPAGAAIHWDRYLNASISDREIVREQLMAFTSGKAAATPSAVREELSKVMLDELRHVIEWDPRHAEGHARIADRLMVEFEMRTAQSDNAMDVTQVRDAAMRSSFASPRALCVWLERAFGSDSSLLFEAAEHAQQAVQLCPLQGDAYLYLADLCFLDGASRTAVKAYVDQGLAVRPYDKYVLFRAGRQQLFLGEAAVALSHWARCFHAPGVHQQQIVYRVVAGGMSASEFVQKFAPRWPGLRDVWINYRERGSDEDLNVLLKYSEEVSERQTSVDDSIQPESIWYWQAMMYSDAGRETEAVACLERAHVANPRQFYVRAALQNALIAMGRYAEAEPHVRWCLARRPADKGLNISLKAVARHRVEQREAIAGNLKPGAQTWKR